MKADRGISRDIHEATSSVWKCSVDRSKRYKHDDDKDKQIPYNVDDSSEDVWGPWATFLSEQQTTLKLHRRTGLRLQSGHKKVTFTTVTGFLFMIVGSLHSKLLRVLENNFG